MKEREIAVTFKPTGRTVYVLPGTTLLETVGRAGTTLQTPCGGNGTCGKCKVRINRGECRATATERRILGNRRIAEGYRLACQARVDSELVVEIPHESLLEQKHRILTHGEDSDVALKPTVRKVRFELSPPNQGRAQPDLERLREEIGEVTVSRDLLCRIPSFMRKNAWKGTAVISNQHLIALEEGDTRDHIYGAAFDIGTTTIAGMLVDLVKNADLAVASCVNPQVAFGDDVLSRIQYTREQGHALAELQSAVIGGMDKLVAELAQKASIPSSAIYEIVVAGNTTMQQVLCGFDPSALGEVPFVPVFDTFQRVHAADFGSTINPGADITVFGQIGGFVGGDTLAGMVATRIDRWEEPALLIDIGTNGEIVLAFDDTIYATSTAAGPAFEGARIRQGMRATTGAIEKVLIGEDVHCNVIGNIPPIGICGTGLIDAAAQMREAGLIDMRGKILAVDETSAEIPPKIRERLVLDDGGRCGFVLVSSAESGSGDPVVLTQKDIRELQLAFAAIRAGINALLKRAELTPASLGAVFLAGAFGNFIRRDSALRIGLLPAVDPQKIRSVGNAALLGAKRALISMEEREYAERLRRRTVHVDLSLDPEFQMDYGMAMMFPECDEAPVKPRDV